MSESRVLRRSAVHACLERLSPVWEECDGALSAAYFGDPEVEVAAARVLGLGDRGVLPRIGLKGSDAVEWASSQGIKVPEEIYGWTREPDDSLTVRLGPAELFLEGPHVSAVEAAQTHAAFDSTSCWPVRREDAALLLAGSKAGEVLAQACSYDFRGAEGRFVMTQVALVSCSILVLSGAADSRAVPVYHLWSAASYGEYLWDELLAIVREFGGGPVGDVAVMALGPRGEQKRT